MNITKVHESYRSVNHTKKMINAYQSNLSSKCETCSKLSTYNFVNITFIYTSDGPLSFSKELVYCPTCGKKVDYGTYL